MYATARRRIGAFRPTFPPAYCHNSIEEFSPHLSAVFSACRHHKIDLPGKSAKLEYEILIVKVRRGAASMLHSRPPCTTTPSRSAAVSFYTASLHKETVNITMSPLPIQYR